MYHKSYQVLTMVPRNSKISILFGMLLFFVSPLRLSRVPITGGHS